MSAHSIRPIKTVDTVDAEIHLPPSKSYTNRALIAASLAEGSSTLLRPSVSDDSQVLMTALKEFGISIQKKANLLELSGSGGKLHPPSKEINVGNAGTAMRFLASFASLASGETLLTGDEQMRQRPMGDLLDALKVAGIKSSSNNGFPPIKITGGSLNGGPITIDGTISSQFISSLLLSAPYAKNDTLLHIRKQPSSLPYVDMSLHVMRSFGAEVTVLDPLTFQISKAQHYIGQTFAIEGDASAATYFFGAAAITGGHVTVKNLSPDSLQGDIRFLDILSEMGCKVTKNEETIEVQGSKLYGSDFDLNALPDCVPTLAVVAAFASGPTTITNVAHLRFKESNRLNALTSELTKIGAVVELHDDGLTIRPHSPHGARIETYNDHRIAMSFAMAGLRIPGMEITNPSCVAKSFPKFWDEFKRLESKE